MVCIDVHHPTSVRRIPEKQVKGTQHHYSGVIRSKSLDERALARMIGSQRQCLEKATRRAKTAPLMTRSLKISECELHVDGYERKPGPKILRSVTTKGSTTHGALLKPSHSPPKSSWQREIRRSKSLAGHERQQKRTKLRPKRVLSASRNDLEDNTKQLQASRFQAPLRTQSASLRRKGFQHQSRENIILESWDEHDPFTEMEMQSACSQNSARSDTKTEDIDTNFISK